MIDRKVPIELGNEKILVALWTSMSFVRFFFFFEFHYIAIVGLEVSM